MSTLQALLFAVVQGITELFPVSSVAHGVLTPFAFGWTLDPSFLKQNFLPFVVMLHLGTATALLIYFWRDWWAFAVSLVAADARTARRTLLLVIVATIPPAMLGFAFESALRGIFASVTSAAAFLIVNGVLLVAGERMRGRGERDIADLSYVQAIAIGLAQSLALIPGFSRSGASMVAGFWAGLRHEAAARFSMLLATPIIAGAGLLEVPKLLHHATPGLVRTALIGGVASGVFAFVAVWVLMRWFRRHETDAMWPFAIYCWVVGAGVLVLRAAG
jgi:undecaprenyl-diphosphatase